MKCWGQMHNLPKTTAAAIRGRSPLLRIVLLLVAILGAAVPAHASIALLMEEPYGAFGAFTPTGHAAINLNHVCAESSTSLRPCYPSEFGVVNNHNHIFLGYYWIAVPLIPNHY